jgi:hypothetical protein
MASVTIDRGTITATSPEGSKASMQIEKLMDYLISKQVDTGELILPDGIKTTKTKGPATILVHETPPKVHNFKWIADDSPVAYGRHAKYREVKLALPYLIMILVFRRTAGRLTLTDLNECYFRNDPLSSMPDSELMYPALLNCSRFAESEGKPLVWICTQHLNREAFSDLENDNARVRTGFKELTRTLLGAAFNYSSEHHEGDSWFSETVRKRVDPRVMSVENWEKATRKDPLFVLQVPWLKTGFTLSQIIDRILGNMKIRNGVVRSASDLARIVFNQQSM